MNKVYPFTTVQLLTDDIYVSYGGVTGTSTAFQRQGAYFTAEEWVTLTINTPVVPAIITGTYFYPQCGDKIQLDWMYLQYIHEIRFIDTKGYNYYTIYGTNNYYAAIRNQERSIIDIFQVIGSCQACSNFASPYQIQIVYTAGLPTGTSTAPSFLMGLTEAAKMVINELIGYGNESVGGVGIEYFKNQDYAEKRTALTNTVFGQSAKAQWILKLINGVRRRTGFGF